MSGLARPSAGDVWNRELQGGRAITMSERRRHAMTASLRATTISALIITSILVGCARRPALTAMTAPAPTAEAERSAEPASAPGAGERSVARQEERRPEPATFAENDNVKTIIVVRPP